MISRAHVLAAVIALCVMLPCRALGEQSAKMQASFTPNRLGGATTVSLALQLGGEGSEPPPLRAIDVAYPPNLGFATSGLGLAPCSQAALEEPGPSACPADSRLGYGSALAGISIGGSLIDEHVQLDLFAGPSPDGYLHILVYALGISPVYAPLVLSGVLREGHLDIAIPPILSFPEAPLLSLVQIRLTLGGRLTYYQHVGSRTVAYRPVGVGLPRRCPRGGFAFAANFAFIDGSSSRARTLVSCPRHA